MLDVPSSWTQDGAERPPRVVPKPLPGQMGLTDNAAPEEDEAPPTPDKAPTAPTGESKSLFSN